MRMYSAYIVRHMGFLDSLEIRKNKLKKNKTLKKILVFLTFFFFFFHIQSIKEDLLYNISPRIHS